MNSLFSLRTALLSACATTILAAASFATSAPAPVDTAPAAICYKVFSPVCTDCPSSTNDYCWPNSKGPFKSCKTLAPENTCTDGYCARVDPGPTGCRQPVVGTAVGS